MASQIHITQLFEYKLLPWSWLCRYQRMCDKQRRLWRWIQLR